MLSIIIHCGVADVDAIEMEFSGLKSLCLNPLSEKYTCEIFQASLLFVEDDICWCDSEEWEDEDSFDYDGIAVRASALRWRVLENSLGSRELYQLQK